MIGQDMEKQDFEELEYEQEFLDTGVLDNLSPQEIAEEIRKIAEEGEHESQLAKNPLWRWRRMLDPLFKRLMAEKPLALDLINAMVYPEGEGEFVDLTFIDKELLPPRADAKLCRVDMLAEMETGEKINLEIQISHDPDFSRRSLYYWSLIHCGQLERGNLYGKINRTIAINLLAFSPLRGERDFRNVYAVCNEKSGNKLCDDLRMIFVEMLKFQRAIKHGYKPNGKIDAWTSFFSGLKEEELMTIAQGSTRSHIEDAVKIEKLFMRSEHERLALARGLMDAHYALTHEESIRTHATKRGMEEGLRQGLEQGREAEKIDLAKKMLARGMAVDVIADLAELSPEAVERLR